MQKAVDRVFEMQDSSGAFGVWGPSNGDLWLTGYVTDFLTRAKEQGFTVNPQGFTPGARPAAELHRLRGGLREGRRGPRLCALRARPQRPRADRRPALLRRHAPRPLLEPARQGPARRRAGDDGRQDARRDGVRRRARSLDETDPTDAYGYRADYGSDLRDSAALVTLAVRDARSRTSRRRSSSTSSPRPTSAAATPRRRSRRGCCWPPTRWPSRPRTPSSIVNGAPVAGPLLRSMSAEDARQDAAHGRQRRRRAGRCGRHRHRRRADARAARLQGLHHRAQLLHARRQAGRPQERHGRQRHR